MRNFTISIYGFHLRHNLSNATDEVLSDASLLWENLSKLGETHLLFPELKNLRSHLICYEKGTYVPNEEQDGETHWLTDCSSIDLGTISPTPNLNIKANLQAFLLNDTYAVDLTLSPETSNQKINLTQLQLFQLNYLLPSSLQASLGETIWLYGEVEKGESNQDFATKLATSFLATTNLQATFVSEDKLFGIPLFEYQAESLRILVSLNDGQASRMNLATQSYDWLLNLLCCHHKINHIHQLASDRYLDNKNLYSYLEDKLQYFDDSTTETTTRLAELEQLIRKLPKKKLDYTRCLQDLQAHQTAISTNIENYRRCLEKIAEITGDKPQSWQKFLELSTKKYQQQISTNAQLFLSRTKAIPKYNRNCSGYC